MPKKPPFNHFRKSCCSPSNSNKKEKGITSAICSLQGMCLPVPTGVGKGSRGNRRTVSGGPASPTSPWHVLDLLAPEDPFLRVGTCMCHWSSCLQQRVHPGGFPPCPAKPVGTTGAAVPTHQKNPGLAGHTRSTGSHSVSSIP